MNNYNCNFAKEKIFSKVIGKKENNQFQNFCDKIIKIIFIISFKILKDIFSFN